MPCMLLQNTCSERAIALVTKLVPTSTRSAKRVRTDSITVVLVRQTKTDELSSVFGSIFRTAVRTRSFKSKVTFLVF